MSASALKSSEGTLPFIVDGETHQTWYKVVGDLQNRTRPPLVVLHGGPGLSHDYLAPIGDLATTASTPVIFYDQIGIGRSSHLPEKPNSFWTIDLFLDELTSLVEALGIQDAFELLGHSWGGHLAVEFAIRRQHPGLRHLILSNTHASQALHGENMQRLLEPFSLEDKQALQVGPDDPHFIVAMKHILERHGCLVQPIPKEVEYSMELGIPGKGDTTVYNAMYTGEYKTWDVRDKLHQVLVPTLVINGRADYMQDIVCAPFFERIPKVKWITLEKSSHMPFWEERERYMEIVDHFLRL
ncbi:hypothetical protein POSPLADRAFT_1143690 [Postia placenta MAD-698-R-SB12]|uniref:AB hydrolase-1 domain-containing protein n=1 Tax=Postia placenta MAD-698-R-SB12 TaxID=670580 RepID=A0A1X6N0X0_9APHY|nr:hypothetical protein POSPLADRAFT_1143690 [Postia placenta MAD-698-R-SB12]OSX62093.1 hypothetical protein POSPLADRAFT_1143690 [Postia placenta MAD-698-R-SB12]